VSDVAPPNPRSDFPAKNIKYRLRARSETLDRAGLTIRWINVIQRIVKMRSDRLDEKSLIRWIISYTHN